MQVGTDRHALRGNALVRLTWPERLDALSMWVVSPAKHYCCGGGTAVMASIDVSAPEEVQLLVNWEMPRDKADRSFRLQTSVLPRGSSRPPSLLDDFVPDGLALWHGHLSSLEDDQMT